MSNLQAAIDHKFGVRNGVRIINDVLVEYPGDMPSADDQAQWIAEYNARLAIINQIVALEATATPRRIREAAIDPAWIKDLDAKIAALREKLD
tara:strand:- start:350 stop:628 length:279 start_codon:yes stop_codon:yes gene_type:complete